MYSALEIEKKDIYFQLQKIHTMQYYVLKLCLGHEDWIGKRTILDIFRLLQVVFKTATEEWKINKNDPKKGYSPVNKKQK